ncbi:MAG: hypothetical protein HKN29_07685 [Rhodothermales bacterium]|nr:hypothetical protein [Rhodothermales bacterium]
MSRTQALLTTLTVSLLLLLTGAPQAQAQTVRVQIDTDTLGIGIRQQATVTIRHDGTRYAVFPDALPQEVPPGSVGLAGHLELLSRISAGSRMLADASQVDSVVYEMTTFAVDTASVAAQVGLATEQDTTWFASVPGLIPVRSVVPEDAQDIQDLAPLVEFPRAIWPWILGILIAGILFWYFFLRNVPEDEEDEDEVWVEPAEPPFDEAMRRLQALGGMTASPDAAKPYFVELSDIVRTYIARRTRVPARELTTHELVTELKRRPVLRAERVGEVHRVLSEADMVKFADQRPAADRARHTLEQARASIEQAERDLAPVAAEVPATTVGGDQ